MRRLRILLAGMVAAGALGAWSGVVHADSPAGGDDFCGFTEELGDALGGGDIGDIDFSDPDAVQEAYEQLADNFEEAAEDAPKKIKSALKTVARFYNKVADVDFSDPEEAAEAFLPSAKVNRAFEKIGNYIAEECGVDPSDTENIDE